MYDNNLPVANFGAVNEHILGHIMRDVVIRAMGEIRLARFAHSVAVKGKHSSGGNDVVTNADTAAQARIKKKLEECFPAFGLIGEEEGLRKDCALDGVDAYFTIDPLDGTLAFTRQQSHGFGPMIALVVNGKVVGVCIGDAMTEELYYYRPGSQRVYRLRRNERSVQLAIETDRPLAEQFALLRAAPEMHSPFVQALVRPRALGGHMKGFEVTGGSIGLSMARLWKGEVGMKVLLPNTKTPWDSTPIIGISRMLGFVFLKVDGTTLVPFEPTLDKEVRTWDHEMIIVHESRVEEIMALASHI